MIQRPAFRSPKIFTMKFDQVRRFALTLPNTTEEPHFNYTSFRVGGKIFVTAPPEQTHIHVFVAEAEREIALAVDGAFVEKLLWGSKALGLRVALAKAPPARVRALVSQAYANKVAKPKRVAAKAPIQLTAAQVPMTNRPQVPRKLAK